MKIYYGWWVVLACFTIGLYVAGIVFYGFTSLFEPLVKEFGWSYTQVSFAASLRGVEMGVLGPLVGFLVDRFGCRKLLLAGIITMGLGLILMSMSRSLLIFYAAFLLIGFGAGGCTNVVTFSAVANWFDKNAGKAFGVMASGFGASGLLIPVIVWLIEVFDWRITLIILGVGIWIVGIPLCFVVRDRPEDDGDSVPGTAGSAPILPGDSSSKKIEMRFRDLLRNKSFLYLNLMDTVRMMAVATVVTHIMPYMTSVGTSRHTAGLVAAAVPLSSILGRFGFGWLSDVLDKKYVMFWTFALMSAGLLAFYFAQVPWMIIIFLLLFPPGFGGSLVLRGVLLRDYFGTGSFGKLLGFLNASAAIGGIIGPTLAGWTFDTTASYRSVWLVLLILISLTSIFIWRLEPAEKS